MRQLGLTKDEAFAQIKRLALALDTDDEALKRTLSDTGAAWNDDLARAELAFLEPTYDEPPPKKLPFCASALAKRIQLTILQQELPDIASSIEIDVARGEADSDDIASGRMKWGAKVKTRLDRLQEDSSRPSAATSEDAFEFLMASRKLRLFGDGEHKRRASRQAIPEPPPLRSPSPEEAVYLFRLCRVGEERINDEFGSDLFTATVSKALAVASSAFTGKASGLSFLRHPIASLRGLVLSLYLLAQTALTRSRSSFAIMILLIAAGAALLVASISDADVPLLASSTGAILVAAGLGYGLLRGGLRRAGAAIAITLSVSLLPIVGKVVANRVNLPRWLENALCTTSADFWPVFLVVAVALGLLFLGAARSKRAGSKPMPPSLKEFRDQYFVSDKEIDSLRSIPFQNGTTPLNIDRWAEIYEAVVGRSPLKKQ
jgi:hypothetical protein